MSKPNPNYLERVRESCIAFETPEARVDKEGAEKFAKDLDIPRIKTLGSNLANLQEYNVVASNTSFAHLGFPDAQAEVNLISVAHALDFGGGFRRELHQHTGKGAWLSIKDGLENMYRRNPAMDAAWLESLTETDIADLYHLSAQRPDGSHTGLAMLITHITKVCHEVGRETRKRGYATMGDLVRENVQQQRTAAALVQLLVDTYPTTFNDVYECLGQTVYLYKKAQLVTGELHHRFATELPEFDFPDAPRMTAFVDNVICAMMRMAGVVACSDSLVQAIETRQQLPSGGVYEVSLRAKALHGVELVCGLTGGQLLPIELGNYLWAVMGKQPSFRQYERHVTQDTTFY